MSLSFYEITVPPFVQILEAFSPLLDKAEAFCAAKKIDPGVLMNARLYPDMLPFAAQVSLTTQHSFGAVNSLKSGKITINRDAPNTFAAAKDLLQTAIDGLKAMAPEGVNALENKDVVFELPHMALTFTAKSYITSFAQPNFYFHAVTAYDILRHNGVELGKREFLGRMQLKP